MALRKSFLWSILALFLATGALAQTCPGSDDEPAMSLKTKTGAFLLICGFEDHETEVPKDKHALTGFNVFLLPDKGKPIRIYGDESAEMFWVGATADGNGVEMSELWYLNENEPQPAIRRDVVCESKSVCRITQPKCTLKVKTKNPFPKALGAFKEKKMKAGEDGEELLDQIWVQALMGEVQAARFYERAPAGMDPSLKEIFRDNQNRLKEAKKLKCP